MMSLDELLKDDLIVILNAIHNLSKMDLIDTNKLVDLEYELIDSLKHLYFKRIKGLISDITTEIHEGFVK